MATRDMPEEKPYGEDDVEPDNGLAPTFETEMPGAAAGSPVDAGVECASGTCTLAVLTDSGAWSSLADAAKSVTAQVADGGDTASCQSSYLACVSVNPTSTTVAACNREAQRCGIDVNAQPRVDCALRFAPCLVTDLLGYDRCIAEYVACEQDAAAAPGAAQGAPAAFGDAGVAICQGAFAGCASGASSPTALEHCATQARQCGFDPEQGGSLNCAAVFAYCFMAHPFDFERCSAETRACEDAEREMGKDPPP